MTALRLATLLSALAFTALTQTACGDPCQDLARKICRCQESSILESQCRAAVDSELNRKGSSGSEKRTCNDILDDRDCDCEAFRARVPKCGFVDTGDTP